ncbi:MAG: ABC transporter permease [Christensenellales bacterium]|nr:ABC transporter permease [Christensenellales bacterium]
MLKAFCKRRKGTLVLLGIALAVLAFVWIKIQAVPGTFQHVYAAPQPVAAEEGAQETNGGLREARLKTRELETELEAACEDATLYALAQPAAVSVPDGGKSASTRLVGVEESWFYLNSPVLLNGRLLYPDECIYGERMALVDEQLAVALFQYAEPLGEEIEVAGQRYRIVGVIKAGKRVGDQMDYSLYVPLRSLEETNVSLTALVYEARPVQGAGGWSAFQTAAQKLGDGTTISLIKERMNAAMPMRMLFTLLGMALALWGVRWMNRRSARFAAAYHDRLQTQYAARLVGFAAGRLLLLALGYVACAAALAWLFTRLVEPVYTFPEWVPAVLVEPKDIQTAFWNVWQTSATVVEYRTPELLRLRFLREVMAWSCGACALLIGSLTGAASMLFKRPAPDGEQSSTECAERS